MHVYEEDGRRGRFHTAVVALNAALEERGAELPPEERGA
jgi:hypothetical protein